MHQEDEIVRRRLRSKLIQQIRWHPERLSGGWLVTNFDFSETHSAQTREIRRRACHARDSDLERLERFRWKGNELTRLRQRRAVERH